MQTTPKANNILGHFFALLGAVVMLAIATWVAASSSEQVQPVDNLTTPRTGHTATALSNGKILITGGRDAAGNLVAASEIFDPATQTTSASASLNTARVDHSATVLANGKVLIAGGTGASGALSSAEIFDPANPGAGFQTLASAMNAARTRHTATLFNDGKVLIAGGDATGTGEIFDPGSQTFLPTLWPLTMVRSGHTATLFTDNSVLLAGGNTATMETYTAGSGFTLDPASMSVARTGHWAFELSDTRLLLFQGDTGNSIDEFNPTTDTITPKGSLDFHASTSTLLANGKVFVLGTGIAGLYNPDAVPPAPDFTQFDEITVPYTWTLLRSGQSAVELPGDKKILISGGVDNNSQFLGQALFNPARIWTDKDDYMPDEPVILTGSGWKGNEAIYLYAVDNETEAWTYETTINANANGGFSVSPLFIVELRHEGVQFHVTALGAQSTMQADVFFTDTFNNVTVGAQNGTPTFGTSSSASYVITVQYTGAGTNSPVNLALAAPTPPGVTASFSPNPVPTPSGPGGGNVTSTLTITTNANTTGANPSGYTFTVRGTAGATTIQNNGTLVVNKASPSFSNVTNKTISQGTASFNVSGSLNTGGGNPVPPVNPPTTTVTVLSASGTITNLVGGSQGNFNNVTVSPTNTFTPGTYTITYNYPGASNFNSATNTSTTLTVTGPSPTPTPTATATLTPTPTATATATPTATPTATSTPTPTPTPTPTNQPPVAVCKNVTVSTDANSCTATVSASSFNNGSSDPDAGDTISFSASPAGPYALGTTPVVLTVADNHGASSTCNATVTVNDTTKPTVTCKNASVNLDASGNASIVEADVVAAKSDNCGTPTITLSKDTFTCADVGPNPVTVTADDGHGNTESCTATVTVNDTIKPTVTCKNVTVSLDASGNATISDSDVVASATDNCGPPTITLSKSTFTCADIGPNPVTVTAKDASNNSESCTATVTVNDTTKPTVTCKNPTVYLDASGNATISDSDVVASATDNCGPPTITLSKSTFTCADIGPNPVTVTAKDASNNSESCTATVTVVDNTAPTVLCKNVTVYLNASGNASISNSDVVASATDNCGTPTITLSKSTFTCADIGPNPVTVSAKDASNNSASCTATVTVVDNTPPTVLCKNATVYLDASGNASISASNVVNSATDNCGTPTIMLSKSAFTCADIGPNTVTVTAKDGSNNTSSCAATVTVVDNTPPTITCPGDKSVDADPLVCTASVSFAATATDNCSASVAYDIGGTSITSPYNFPVGVTTVHAKATDPSGNSSDCSFKVTVNNPNPVVTMTGPPNGSVYAINTPVTFTGTFTDAGGGTHTGTWSFDAITKAATINETSGTANATYTFTAAGVYTVTLKIDDSCGGSGTATLKDGLPFLVIVYDPSGGFVTGGGFINSPVNAYLYDLTLTGKANFGFVSKYQKGANVPTGETEFQFQVANFNFHSTVYQWLVVSGPKAQYKGTGTINGSNGPNGYSFLLTATDGQVGGGGGVDKFRMKIWDTLTGSIIYDNARGSTDDIDTANPQAIAGGSIVIHK